MLRCGGHRRRRSRGRGAALMSRHKDVLGPKAVVRRIGLALISARARALMSIGIVLGLGAVGTLAAWSDTSTATSGIFTTGTLDIKLGEPFPGSDNVTLATLGNAAIVPGTTVSSPLKINNNGSVPFSYKIEVVASNAALGGLLDSSIYAAATCTVSPASTVEKLTPSKFFQQTTPTPGDLTRGPIAVGASDQLCISVTMPSSVAAPSVPASGTVSFTFRATSS